MEAMVKTPCYGGSKEVPHILPGPSMIRRICGAYCDPSKYSGDFWWENICKQDNENTETSLL
jgi:hypothetical protein